MVAKGRGCPVLAGVILNQHPPHCCWSTELKVKIAIMGTNSSMVGLVQRWNVDPEQEHPTQEGSLLGS